MPFCRLLRFRFVSTEVQTVGTCGINSALPAILRHAFPTAHVAAAAVAMAFLRNTYNIHNATHAPHPAFCP